MPFQTALSKLGPGQLGTEAQLCGVQLSTFWGGQLDPRKLGPMAQLLTFSGRTVGIQGDFFSIVFRVIWVIEALRDLSQTWFICQLHDVTYIRTHCSLPNLPFFPLIWNHVSQQIHQIWRTMQIGRTKTTTF